MFDDYGKVEATSSSSSHFPENLGRRPPFPGYACGIVDAFNDLITWL